MDKRQKDLRELADTLEMFANQIREHTEDAQNGLPSPWAFDDWLENYREARQKS